MLITNALLIDAETEKKGALRIKNGAIEAVGDLSAQSGEETLDAQGKWLIPGVVDMDFHLCDPGHKRIETISESTSSALLGGITTILASPDTTPPIDNETVVEYILTKAAASNGARLLLSGEIAKGTQINNIAKLFAVGVRAIEGTSALDGNVLRRAFEYALMADKPLALICENPAIDGSGVMHEGEISARLGLPALSDFGESSEVARVAELARAIGAKTLIKAVSAASSLGVLRPNNKLWLQVLLPHLLLTDNDCWGFNTACKIFPPLRSGDDQAALLEATKSGENLVLSSGHLSQDESSRDRPFELAGAGMDTAGIFISLAYTYLIASGKLTAHEFVRAASLNPAKLLGEPCGALAAGLRADLVLFDPNAKRVVALRDGVARNYWSGKTLDGAVAAAFVGGARVL
ncbi:dihydroorotase [Campylobacterota bacterium]|nr:dihydroorotase [Campylobacterota bacterium]